MQAAVLASGSPDRRSRLDLAHALGLHLDRVEEEPVHARVRVVLGDLVVQDLALFPPIAALQPGPAEHLVRVDDVAVAAGFSFPMSSR